MSDSIEWAQFVAAKFGKISATRLDRVVSNPFFGAPSDWEFEPEGWATENITLYPLIEDDE